LDLLFAVKKKKKKTPLVECNGVGLWRCGTICLQLGEPELQCWFFQKVSLWRIKEANKRGKERDNVDTYEKCTPSVSLN